MDLGIKYAMRIRHIVICGLPGSTFFFLKLSHTRHDFRKRKELLNIKRVSLFSLQILSEIFLILERNDRDMIRKIHWYSLILSDFNET